MERRALGRTGIEVPRLSFGASPFGGVFGPVEPSDADRAVRAAIDSGIDLFDTAPFYGLGRSETVLGAALRGISRDRFLVSTKVGRYGASAFDFSADRIRESIDVSLARLGVDHVDLLVCHDIEYGDPERIVQESLPAMRALVQQGKARAVGISGYPLGIFPWVARRAPIDFVLSYCHLTLQDRTLLPWLPWFAARGIGVVNASPLGMGLLTDGGPPDWHPAPARVRSACSKAAAACRSAGMSLADAALAWSAGVPGVATTLVGMADAATVARNRAAIESSPMETVPDVIGSCLREVLDTGWTSGGWGDDVAVPDQESPFQI